MEFNFKRNDIFPVIVGLESGEVISIVCKSFEIKKSKNLIDGVAFFNFNAVEGEAHRVRLSVRDLLKHRMVLGFENTLAVRSVRVDGLVLWGGE